MATALQNIFSRWAPAEAAPGNARDHAVAAPSGLRALPNEDVYFFIKRIDNSRVVREADPRARRRSWKVLGFAASTAVLLIGALLPSAYGLMAGYQLHNLQLENQRLVNERASLELEEARLVSPERLQELARQQQFVDPTPEHVMYLPSKDEAVAMRRH